MASRQKGLWAGAHGWGVWRVEEKKLPYFQNPKLGRYVPPIVSEHCGEGGNAGSANKRSSMALTHPNETGAFQLVITLLCPISPVITLL